MDKLCKRKPAICKEIFVQQTQCVEFRGKISHRNRLKKSLEGTQDMLWQDKWLSDELWALPKVKQILTVEV